MKFQSWTVFLVAIILSTANAYQKSSLILSAKWGTFDFPGGCGSEWSSSFSVTCTVSQPSCVIVSIVLWLSIGCLELVWFLTYHEQLWVVPV